jgi:hypothetical protein
MAIRNSIRAAAIVLCAGIGLTAVGTVSQAQVVPAPTSPPTTFAVPRSERLGITFINSAQLHASEARYYNALQLGAGWNRYPIYWDKIERQPGVFTWSEYDQVVIEDTRHQLRANVILIGIPSFHRRGSAPIGLDEPIFAHGSDLPRAGDNLINPANPWASFVYQTVQRYKPGGTLAQQQGWQAGEGVRVWEIWNEPDLPQFWRGGIQAYARLLKTAYVVIKLADPSAQVMFGGLLFPAQENWLARVLAIFSSDPSAAQNNFYFDIVAVHSYTDPWRSGWLVLYARQTLATYQLSKPIWLNESGVSVWDDYPGPTWARTSDERRGFATADQQAWYFVQSSAYAWSEGAEVVFFHQLYDDCGDQPAGTNFPPHDGSLCLGSGLCWGSAFGLFRNEANALCFSQSRRPGTPRPAANAYRLVAQVFGAEPFEPQGKPERTSDGITLIRFSRPRTGERITVLWNQTLQQKTITLPAEGSSAQLYALHANTRIVPDISRTYTLTLAAAQPDSAGPLADEREVAIGGPPLILVERPASEVDAPPPNNWMPASAGPILPTPGALPAPRPTTEPSADRTPPRPFMRPLPEASPPVFTVTWGAEDDGEVVRYLVWVRVDEGKWLPWLETHQQEAAFTGERGRRYAFAVWAQDAGGNWSTNIELQPMATTRVD